MAFPGNSTTNSQSSTTRSLIDALDDSDDESCQDDSSTSTTSTSGDVGMNAHTYNVESHLPLHEQIVRMDQHQQQQHQHQQQQENDVGHGNSFQQQPSKAIRNGENHYRYQEAVVRNFPPTVSQGDVIFQRERQNHYKENNKQPQDQGSSRIFLHRSNTLDSIEDEGASVKSSISSLSGSRQTYYEERQQPTCTSRTMTSSAAPLILESNPNPLPPVPPSNYLNIEEHNMLVLNSKTSSRSTEVKLGSKTPMPTPTLQHLWAQGRRLTTIPFTPLVTRSRWRDARPLEHDTTATTTMTAAAATTAAAAAAATCPLSASAFSKSAPQAGYLAKFGTSIPEFKRRFFVLKPTTCLYYFLSPMDEEPRGCIDLEGDGLDVKELGVLPDGRFRFEIRLPIRDEMFGHEEEVEEEMKGQEEQPHRKVLLEARNEDIGRQWMQSITTERLSFAKNTADDLYEQVRTLKQTQGGLEAKIEKLRLVEKDRDGAIQDANEWREKWETLDTALGTLKKWMNRSSEKSSEKENTMSGDIQENCSIDGKRTSEDSSVNDTSQMSARDNSVYKSIDCDDLILENINLPGTQFASLSNVCQGLRENLRLTSIEATNALDDLTNTNTKVKDLEGRLKKAEKYICKQWEENCTLRGTLKQKKDEKKVLVKEVRSLMEEVHMFKRESENLKSKIRPKEEISHAKEKMKPTNGQETICDENVLISSQEEREMLDLESQIGLTLREHDDLMSRTSETDTAYQDIRKPSLSNSIGSSSPGSKILASVPKTVKTSNTTKKLVEVSNHKLKVSDDKSSHEERHQSKLSLSPLRPKTLSLMDTVVLSENSSDGATQISAKSLSVASEGRKKFGSFEDETQESSSLNESSSRVEQSPITFQNSMKESMLQLETDSIPPSPINISLRSKVTENCRATSQLISPLTDVMSSEIKPHSQGHIYNLTFHTSKIGIQFQKVDCQVSPPGKLSSVLSDDHLVKKDFESLSNLAHFNEKGAKEKEMPYPVLFPKDWVLVCGFNGFDNTSGQRKPSLGAHLIAFDGISVERGPWTFETVRKAIKARGRPLTLTFRDDFLTTEQRAVLTRATREVKTSTSNKIMQGHYAEDIGKATNHHTSHPIQLPKRNNSWTEITSAKSQNRRVFRRNEDENDYIISADESDADTTLSGSAWSQVSDNLRSFSEAGTSSVFSTKFAPLVAGLLNGIPPDDEDKLFSPEYFRRPADTLDSTPHHRNFKASLL